MREAANFVHEAHHMPAEKRLTRLLRVLGCIGEGGKTFDPTKIENQSVIVSEHIVFGADDSDSEGTSISARDQL